VTIRIGTWNILGRKNYHQGGSAGVGAIASVLADHTVDVLCLQEVHFFGGRPEPQVTEELHEAGLTELVTEPLSPSHLDPQAQLGILIASRHPITGKRTFRLPNPGISAQVRGATWTMHDKGLLGATVLPEGNEPVEVYTLHLFPFFEFGIAEAHQHVREMWQEFWRYVDGEVGHGPMVLAGDFNHQNRSSAARRWSGQPWRFCFDRRPTTENGLSLDDIAVNRPVGVRTQVTPTFSDHRLAVAELTLGGPVVEHVPQRSMVSPG
jgi:endonuclease/exonuclease/phosphatase family metal-dependent hydrolase